MKKKKITFIIITTILLITASIIIYCSYDITQSEEKKPNFNSNNILYDILNNVYTLNYQLDKISKNENIEKYISANKKATKEFYRDAIIYNREMLPEKKNIKYYALSDNNSIGNTNDDLRTIQTNHQLQDKYQWYLKLNFDENGNISYDSLGCKKSENQNFELIWENFKQTYFLYLENYDNNYTLHNPTNITIYFAIPAKLVNNSFDVLSYYSGNNSITTNLSNIVPVVTIFVIILFLFILIYPYSIEKEVIMFNQLAKIKLEIFIAIASSFFIGSFIILYGLMYDTLNGYYLKKMSEFISQNYSSIIVTGMNIVSWIIFLFFIVISSYYIKTVFKKGFYETIKNNTLCAMIIKKFKKIIIKLINFDFNNSINKFILKILLTNFIVISIMCCFYIYGILLAIIYSIILFIILKNKLGKYKNDYQTLLNALQRLSNGDFDVNIKNDIGIFNSLGKEFSNIKNGFKKAVNEEIKSQKMKTELITNVSHDLKTPLTSIITYLDLLKNNNCDHEKQIDYITTLEHNSARLKKLIDDLFEISKINSGNIKLELIDVDIIALIQQAKFEADAYLNNKNLIFKTNYPDHKIILNLDSLKTYRIFENLFTNISKYALNNSRVYIEVLDNQNFVTIIFKNISADEIKISESQLVERFVQGDSSRNSKGSGLGLAIAKSFTELQNGNFKIKVDGDLFKVIIVFKK